VFQWHNGESTLVGHIERGEGRSEKSEKLRPGALFRIIGSPTYLACVSHRRPCWLGIGN
jgi:hypothetical protein